MLQIQNTKKVLAMSLKSIMAEKPLNKITIREIVENCGLNRQTFYYHFKDIYDLLEWMYHEETIALLSQYHDLGDWQEGALAILYYVKENAAACECALHSMGNTQLRKFIHTDFRDIYRQVFDLLTFNLDVDGNFKEFIANLCVYGAEGYVIHWLESGMKDSPEQIVEWLSFFIEGNIRQIMERFAKNKEAIKGLS